MIYYAQTTSQQVCRKTYGKLKLLHPTWIRGTLTKQKWKILLLGLPRIHFSKIRNHPVWIWYMCTFFFEMSTIISSLKFIIFLKHVVLQQVFKLVISLSNSHSWFRQRTWSSCTFGPWWFLLLCLEKEKKEKKVYISIVYLLSSLPPFNHTLTSFYLPSLTLALIYLVLFLSHSLLISYSIMLSLLFLCSFILSWSIYFF